ncbi:MAG: hypothetical protein P4K83_11755 [Terracidiphilus sp.]|nr:hypothetical protein [Terracidiphilus sp.]
MLEPAVRRSSAADGLARRFFKRPYLTVAMWMAGTPQILPVLSFSPAMGVGKPVTGTKSAI